MTTDLQNSPAWEKLQSVRKHMNHAIHERKPEIDGILMAMLSETTAFFLGEPGTAKSMMIDTACESMNASVFSILLSETTRPDQIFGPVDVPALAAGKQQHKMQGYAPTADVLFFDEIFKAGAPVLNPLLQIINERKFRDGDNGYISCPVKTTFAASNEIPTDSVLEAIYDRFLLRYNVKYMQSFNSLLKSARQTLAGESTHPSVTLTDEELQELRAATKRVSISDALIEKAQSLRVSIEHATETKFSDRRFLQSLKLIQAMAVLEGKQEATNEHLSVLAHVFWNTPDHIPAVQSLVASACEGDTEILGMYAEESDAILSKLHEGGDLPARLSRLKAIYKSVKAKSGSYAASVASRIRAAGRQYEQLIEARKTLSLLRQETEEGPMYRLPPAARGNWTTDEIRSAGFRLRRKYGYYWTRDAATLKGWAQANGVQIRVSQ